mmetsp:Transcript_28947/g.65647  ORF Transcript_28947/g.65647 Transcript_28947/m.65647 type:complete len:689 (-) Transcript_28947:2-2068(-)
MCSSTFATGRHLSARAPSAFRRSSPEVHRLPRNHLVVLVHKLIHGFQGVGIGALLAVLIYHPVLLEVAYVVFPLPSALGQVGLQRVRLPLLPRLEPVRLPHLGAESWDVATERHAHGQSVGRGNHIGRPDVRLVPGQLVVDQPPVLRVVQEPIALLDRGSEAWPNAEGAEVLGLHALRPQVDEPQGVAVDPSADNLLDAQLLVNLEAGLRANGLDEHLGVHLLTLLGVDALVADPLHLVDYALHDAIVAGEEVDVRHAENRLLRNLREGSLGVRVHRVRIPDVKADEVVHLGKRLQQHRRRNRSWLTPNKPGGHLRPAEIPGSADHVAFLTPVLNKGSHVLDGEGTMAVESAHPVYTQVVIDLVERAVLHVASELVLPWELNHVGQVQETGPSAHEADHHHAAISVLLVLPELVRGNVLHGVGPVLRGELFHLVVEQGVLVQPMFPGVLPHHVQERVPRRPRLVVQVVDLEGHRLPRLAVVHVVCAPLGLQLRELVCGPDPRVAAEVRMRLHADDVFSPTELHVDHRLDGAEASTQDEDRVVELLDLPAEGLDADDRDIAGHLIPRLQDRLVGALLVLQDDVSRISLEHRGQDVLQLRRRGAGLATKLQCLLAALQDDGDRPVRVGEVLALQVALLLLHGQEDATVRYVLRKNERSRHGARSVAPRRRWCSTRDRRPAVPRHHGQFEP